MFDIKLIREREADVRRALQTRGATGDLDAVLALDKERRSIVSQVEALKNRRNVVSKEIGTLKKEGKDAGDIQKSMRDLGNEITGQWIGKSARLRIELASALLFFRTCPTLAFLWAKM